jgi:hypothetical protein
MDIFVFRTGVTKTEHVHKVAPHLNSLSGIHKWTFDLDDSEKILRVEAAGISAGEIEKTLAKANYYCEELPD